MAEFYRAKTGTVDNLYDAKTNQLLTPTQFKTGGYTTDLGFRTATTAAAGSVAIPGATYNTKELQQANFTNIQPVGNTLYGIPKVTNTVTGADVANANKELADLKTQNQANMYQQYQNSLASNQEAFNKQLEDIKAQYQTTVSPIKTNLADVSSKLTSKQNELRQYDTATTAGTLGLEGQGRGITASLVSGQQEKLGRQRALDRLSMAQEETNLIQQKQDLANQLNIARTDYKDEQELAFKMQERIGQNNTNVLNAARQMSQDAQTKFTSIMSMFKEGLISGSTPTQLDNMKTQLGALAQQAGIPVNLAIEGFDAIQNEIKYEQLLNSQKLASDQQQTSFNQSMALENLKLDRAKFSSDEAYRQANLALDAAKLNASGTTKAPDIQKINGTDMQWNPVTLKWETPSQTSATTTSQQDIDSANSMLDAAKKLEQIGINGWTTGGGSLLKFAPESPASDFSIILDSLVGSETLKNMGLIKGVLSDSDMKLLKSASTGGLNQKLSPALFKERLDAMKNAAQSVINSSKIQPGQIIYNDDSSLAGAGNGDQNHTGTYSYKQKDGTMHTGNIGDGWIDKTKYPSPSFSNVGGDTQKAVSTLMSIPDNQKGGQCGRFVNQLTGLGVGDSYASKMSKMDPSITKPEPGMIFTMPYKDTGHVGFIVGIDGDKAIVKDSNYYTSSAPEQIATHTIPLSKITGLRRLA